MPSRRSDDRKAAVSPWRSIGEAAEQVIKGLASSRPPLQPDEAPAGDDNAAAEIMANVAEAATMRERQRCIGIVRTCGHAANQIAFAGSIILKIEDEDRRQTSCHRPIVDIPATLDRRDAKIARILVAKQEARRARNDV